jgi:uncharacterized membrane protein
MNMSEQWLAVAAPILAAACGLVGGVFFAFSNFIMKALARLAPAQGIAAMQSINVVVLNPGFLGVFLGTALVCALVLLLAFLPWRPEQSGYVIVGALLYLIGTFLVTMAANAPRNNALAALDPLAASSASLWNRYVVEWTFWNHVRTAASLAASLAFCWSLVARS